MNKKEIHSDYKKKIDKFKEYNKAYFEDSNPKISDKEFDKHYTKIFIEELNKL